MPSYSMNKYFQIIIHTVREIDLIYNVRGQVNMTFSQTSCNSRGITKNKQLRYNNNFSHSFSMLL